MEKPDYFSSLKSLAVRLDKKLDNLESQLSYNLVFNSKSTFSADTSDEVFEEVTQMRKAAEGIVQQLTEESSNREAFIQGILDTAVEMEENVKQVEQIAQQYGYAPKERKSLEEAYAEFLEKKNSQPPDAPETTQNTETSKTGLEDMPNVLTIGLTKETLSTLGFRFKEDVGQEISQQANRSTEREAHGNSANDENQDTENSANHDQSSSDEHISPIPIIKSWKPKMEHESPSGSQFYMEEISPGLVVKRPSSRITPKNPTVEAVTPQVAAPASTSNATDSPPTPKLTTMDFGACSQRSVLPAEPTKPFAEITPPRVLISKTPLSPQAPDLRTMDLRSLLQATHVAGNKSERKESHKKTDFRERNLSSVKSNTLSDSPKMPDLRTMDLGSLLRAINMSSSSNPRFGLSSQPEAKNCSKDKDQTEKENYC